MLNACGTLEPERLPGLTYLDAGPTAYLWRLGIHGGNFWSGTPLADYALVTHIDHINVDSGAPVEIPVGEHIVQITYKEHTVNPVIPLGMFYGLAYVSESSLRFNAEQNRAYAPYTGDDCDREWFWIEDLGPFDPTVGRGNLGSNLTRPVVAGEAPPVNCEQGYKRVQTEQSKSTSPTSHGENPEQSTVVQDGSMSPSQIEEAQKLVKELTKLIGKSKKANGISLAVLPWFIDSVQSASDIGSEDAETYSLKGITQALQSKEAQVFYYKDAQHMDSISQTGRSKNQLWGETLWNGRRQINAEYAASLAKKLEMDVVLVGYMRWRGEGSYCGGIAPIEVFLIHGDSESVYRSFGSAECDLVDLQREVKKLVQRVLRRFLLSRQFEQSTRIMIYTRFS